MGTKTKKSELELALEDYKASHIYVDGNGNWRWNTNKPGVAATKRGIHPANRLLKQIGNMDRVHDAAHGHTISTATYDKIRDIFMVVTNRDHKLYREMYSKTDRDGVIYSCSTNPSARREMLINLLQWLEDKGIDCWNFAREDLVSSKVVGMP